MENLWLPVFGDPWWNAITFGLLAFIVLYCYSTWTYDTFSKHNIPGPKPLPFIGNLGHILRKDPTEWQTAYANHFGKVYGIYFGRSPYLVVADPDMVREITAKQFQCFTNRSPSLRALPKPLDRVLNGLTNDHWKHVRGTITPAFTSGKLKQMMATIGGCSTALSSYLENHKGENIDVKMIGGAYSMNVIAGTAFGLDVRSLENPNHPFLHSAQECVSSAVGRNIRQKIALFATMTSLALGRILAACGIPLIDPKCVAYIENILKPLLRKEEGNMDKNNFVQLCSDLLVEIENVPKDSVRISNNLIWTTAGLLADDLTSSAILFILAGHESTSSLLTTFFYAMATNSHVQEKLGREIEKFLGEDEYITYERLKDMEYLDWCVDETLRMYPPVARIERNCNETATIGGVRISHGMGVYVPVYAIHHDPKYWPAPYEFRPERFSPDESSSRHPCAYIPFGFGPRNCIGMRLALLEAKAAIAQVLSKFVVRPCKDTQIGPLTWNKGHFILTPEDPVLLNFVKRYN